MRQSDLVRIVVIGSGIVGASTAYHLVRRGADVVLVDRGDPGQATAAGAGIISPWLARLTDPAWHAIARPAARYYPRLGAELDLEYARVGALYVAPEGEQLAELHR